MSRDPAEEKINRERSDLQSQVPRLAYLTSRARGFAGSGIHGGAPDRSNNPVEGSETCPDCGRSLKSQPILTIHQRMHTGEIAFTCQDCGKSFGHRSTLIRHRRFHCIIKTGKRPLYSSIPTSAVLRSYKCGICSDTFQSPTELKRHLSSHTGEHRYMCRECGRTFSCNFYLVRHQRTHSGERPFTCPQCNKSFKCSSVLSRHQRTHTGEQPFKCEVCARGFTQKTSLIIHLRTHTGERPFSCQLCGRSFCSSSALIRHEQRHSQGGSWADKHLAATEDPAADERCVEGAGMDGNLGAEEERWVSAHGDLSGEDAGDVKDVTNETEDWSTAHGVEYESDTYGSALNTVQVISSGFIYPEYSKAFSPQAVLNGHHTTHTGERPFCPDCGKIFGHRSSLLRHQHSYCSLRTGKGAGSSTLLSAAISVPHSHKCGICHISFSGPNELRRHLSSHTGEHRYMCMECGRTFNSNYFLVRHQRTHSGERPFTCPQCNKSFKCNSVLSRHQRTHTGEQPFKCEVCARGFTQKTSLIIHLRTHTGERPFSCQLCGRSFCSSSALIRHEQRHRHLIGESLGYGNTKSDEVRKSVSDPAQTTAEGAVDEEELDVREVPEEEEEPDVREVPEEGEELDVRKVPEVGFSYESSLQAEHESGVICPDCGKTFQSQSFYTEHQSTHSAKRRFTCFGCGKSFAHQSSLLRHRSTHCHNKSKKALTNHSSVALAEILPQSYKCGICNETFPSTHELRRHLGSHTGEHRYSCQDCGRTFTCNYFLVRHQRTHTGEQPYPCQVCSRAFSQKTSLVIHLRTHTGERPYACQLCDRSFCSRSAMVRHHRSHRDQRSKKAKHQTKRGDLKVSPVKLKISELSLPGDDIPETTRINQPVTTDQSTDCLRDQPEEWRAETKQEETEVIENHPQNKPAGSSGIQCLDCWKTFKTKAHLTVHRRMHTGERPFICSGCGKSFGHRSTLIRHKNFHCSIKTGRSFSNQTLSSAQRFYKCGICHASYPSPIELKRHLSSHTGEHRYMCRECGRTFSCNFYLVRHQRTHSGERPFTCPQCNKSFKCSSVLYRHQRTHTGEQPFKCEVCAKGFTQKTSLIIHLRTHTGERPFSCQFCGRSFCSSSALIRHEQSHHKAGQWTCGSMSYRKTEDLPVNSPVKLESNQSMQGEDLQTAEERCLDLLRESVNDLGKDLESGVHKDAANRETETRQGDGLQKPLHSEPEDSGFICPECGEFFKSQSILSTHQKSHAKGCRLTCSDCGKSFGHRSSLQRHRTSYCRLKTGRGLTKPSLANLAVQHSYKCGICQMNFFSPKELRRHLGSHKGKHQYMCTVCGRMFSSNYFLVRHQRTHSGERPFTCLQCNKSFKCSSVLSRHQRTHTGEQPFKCEVCARGFTQKTSLIIHLRTHTGERPFSCQLCGRSFCSSSALIRHEQSHQHRVRETEIVTV